MIRQIFLPVWLSFVGEYYLINGHHQTTALIERGQTLWIYDVYEYFGPNDFLIVLRGQ